MLEKATVLGVFNMEKSLSERWICPREVRENMITMLIIAAIDSSASAAPLVVHLHPSVAMYETKGKTWLEINKNEHLTQT